MGNLDGIGPFILFHNQPPSRHVHTTISINVCDGVCKSSSISVNRPIRVNSHPTQFTLFMYVVAAATINELFICLQ